MLQMPKSFVRLHAEEGVRRVGWLVGRWSAPVVMQVGTKTHTFGMLVPRGVTNV